MQLQQKFQVIIKQITNFTGANEIYLHDKISNQYYDIKTAFMK
jgi:hypothetical protein